MLEMIHKQMECPFIYLEADTVRDSLFSFLVYV